MDLELKIAVCCARDSLQSLDLQRHLRSLGGVVTTQDSPADMFVYFNYPLPDDCDMQDSPHASRAGRVLIIAHGSEFNRNIQKALFRSLIVPLVNLHKGINLIDLPDQYDRNGFLDLCAFLCSRQSRLITGQIF